MGCFKTYDLRGRYPDEVDEALFTRIGLAVPRALAAKTVVVGRDLRESSPELSLALIKGLTQAGVRVTDIGVVSTPMLYFATAHWKADAGVMVTASHRPAVYNGAKFCRAGAYPVASTAGLLEIERLALSGQLNPSSESGAVEERDIGPEYRAHLLKFADSIEPQTVVVDAAGGVMGGFIPKLFAKLPCELIRLRFEPGEGGRRTAPFRPDQLAGLAERVRETGADLGVALDYDGDRCLFVDGEGEPIPADLVTALLANEMITREPGATVLYDLRSSRVCREEIERLGGRAIETRVGHSFIKERMREEGAIFAGEVSGHYYFRDIYATDNAEMALLAVLGAMGRNSAALRDLIAPLRRYASTGEVDFSVTDPDEALERVEAAFAGAGVEVARLDGLSLLTPEWWCNLRPANTEALLRLNLEAIDNTVLARVRRELEALLLAPTPAPAPKKRSRPSCRAG